MPELEIKKNNVYYGFPTEMNIIDLKAKHIIENSNHYLINCIKKDNVVDYKNISITH